MRFRVEARRDAYDVIVVGSGIGGLTAAALLARAGRSVLVVERHDRVGGYAHSFRRGRYLFDSAVHLVGGCEPDGFGGGGLIDSLLTSLGVRDQCEFARIDPCYTAVYPGSVVNVPCSIEGFVRSHTEDGHAESKALRQLLQECLDVREETKRASQLPSPFGAVTDARRFPTLVRYRRATLAQVLDTQLESLELKALVGTLWPYLGLPPSRVSFLYFANMLMSYLTEGAFYCRGSFQRFADALATAINGNGGEILLKSPVRRIRVENGRACGIVLEHGQRIDAPIVLSNADARQTVEELVGIESFPTRYVATLRRMKPSLSSFIVHAASSLPLAARDVSHETFLYSSLDHDQAHRSSLTGEPAWLSVTVPTLADPSLAPRGEHLVILTTLVPYGAQADWRAGKERLTARMLEMADRHFPGLCENLTFVESGTPRTLERYTRNSGGALYGWELSPAQVGSGRLAGGTPIAGLRLVGHWTQPGGGVYGVVSSGIVTARSVLGPDAALDLD
jgi:phytoene dehydrogenase-like protein